MQLMAVVIALTAPLLTCDRNHKNVSSLQKKNWKLQCGCKSCSHCIHQFNYISYLNFPTVCKIYTPNGAVVPWTL